MDISERIQHDKFGQARLLVVGLDSATLQVCEPLLEMGEMPNLAELIGRGASGPMRSTIPPLSPAAWVTAITGLNPGQHGVYDFRHLDLAKIHGRSSELVSSSTYAGSTIFDTLSRRGLRVGAFNIPLTYPPWPVNGLMVSGPISPDLRRAFTSPSDLGDRLGPMGQHTSPQHLDSFDIRKFFEELVTSTEDHFQYGIQLLQEEGPFDLFWFHLHSLDSIQHRFWRYSTFNSERDQQEESSPYSDTIQNFYRLADEGLGKLLEMVGPGSYVLVLSDHGATSRGKFELQINALLRTGGWLNTYREVPGKRFVRAFHQRFLLGLSERSRDLIPDDFLASGVNWTKTRAHGFHLADPIGGIVLSAGNPLRKDETKETDYFNDKRALKEWLLSLRDPQSGQPIIEHIWDREELYAGPFAEAAPDILFQVSERYHIGSGLTEPVIRPTATPGPGDWSGVHSLDGIVVFAGPQIVPGLDLSEATLIDVVPTLLYCLGEPLPRNLEGSPWLRAFQDAYRKQSEVKYCEPDTSSLTNGPDLDRDEESSMLSHLRSLGYIE